MPTMASLSGYHCCGCITATPQQSGIGLPRNTSRVVSCGRLCNRVCASRAIGTLRQLFALVAESLQASSMGSQQRFDQKRLKHPVSPAYRAIASPSSPRYPRPSIIMDGQFESSLSQKQARHGTRFKGCRSQVTIDKLPDVILLRIFDFYMDEEHIQGWHSLVHVCREWRTVVFGSPRRLNLRLRCTNRTRVREMLGIWPLLPIAVRGRGLTDNIIAALEHNDRICQLILFGISSGQLEKVLTAIQRPFPALTRLELQFEDKTAPIDSYLGGSAPLFSGLPTLLLSATHLVHLSLRRISDSGYISPEAMVTCLSVLTRLKSLEIGFKSPWSRPDWNSRRPPPQTRTLLPNLTLLWFIGVSEYLEDFLCRIDTPLLDKLHITFFHKPLFYTAQLTQFIGRTSKFETHDEAHVGFSDWRISVTIPQASGGRLYLGILRGAQDLSWEPLPLAQVCSSSFPWALVSMVEDLYILEYGRSGLSWQDDEWMEFLHPFTGVKGLYISQEFVPRIAPTFQLLTRERATEVLPALQTLSLEKPPPSEPDTAPMDTIGQFIAARRLAGHTIAVFLWER